MQISEKETTPLDEDFRLKELIIGKFDSTLHHIIFSRHSGRFYVEYEPMLHTINLD